MAPPSGVTDLGRRMDTLSENWARLTPSERMDLRFERWQNDNAMVVSNLARDTFIARTSHITMAMRMSGIPDQVPVPTGISERYPVHRAGLTSCDAMYDLDRTSDAYKEFHGSSSPDAMVSATGATLPGKVFEVLGCRLYSWRGHGVPRETIYQYDRTDMARAKATVGRVAAIQVNVPLSLMHAGSPTEVKDYCRRLIDVTAPGGGLLLDIGAVMHQAKEENMQVVLEAGRDVRGLLTKGEITCTNS